MWSMIEITKYIADHDWCPFDIWMDGLKDSKAKAKILTRIQRLSQGNEGYWKSVGEDVRELIIDVGKAYRVYYGWTGSEAVLLLCGGSKSKQSNDIKQAKEYWRQYNEQK